MNESKSPRIFFALWPNDAVRRQIIQAFNRAPQSSMPGRYMDVENLHMTLHFIGNVSKQALQCMREVAKTINAKSFSLKLDRYGHFYKPKVFWMGCHELPVKARALHADLGAALKPCGYEAERRPFAPHVTLMRKLAKPGDLKDFESIEWQVDEFVLVQSVPVKEGVRYDVIERYPFN